MADAFLITPHYPAGKMDVDRLIAINKEFGPLLDCKRVQVAQVHLGSRVMNLLRARHDGPPYFFPKGHARDGQDRYTWADRGDGVMEGTLVPDGEVPRAN